MFQVKIINSYQLQTYERVMDCVNQFCASHDVVEVKSDLKKDDVIYSIVFRVSQDKGSAGLQSTTGQEMPCFGPSISEQRNMGVEP